MASCLFKSRTLAVATVRLSFDIAPEPDCCTFKDRIQEAVKKSKIQFVPARSSGHDGINPEHSPSPKLPCRFGSPGRSSPAQREAHGLSGQMAAAMTDSRPACLPFSIPTCAILGGSSFFFSGGAACARGRAERLNHEGRVMVSIEMVVG
jgi:hypothetical protein